MKIDVDDNDWLKKNQRRYVKAVESDVRDFDRLKKIAEAMRKQLQAMCRIMIGK